MHTSEQRRQQRLGGGEVEAEEQKAQEVKGSKCQDRQAGSKPVLYEVVVGLLYPPNRHTHKII